jgi:hypothetical protein
MNSLHFSRRDFCRSALAAGMTVSRASSSGSGEPDFQPRRDRMFAVTRSLIPATAAALLLLCACGGSSPAQAASPSPAADVARTWHQVAQCIRDHGQPNFPEPIVDSAGHASLPPGTQQPPDSVLQACQSIINRLPPQFRPHGGSAQQMDQLAKLVQCLNQHGIHATVQNGELVLPPDTDTGSAKSVRAQFCRQYGG